MSIENFLYWDKFASLVWQDWHMFKYPQWSRETHPGEMYQFFSEELHRKAASSAGY